MQKHLLRVAVLLLLPATVVCAGLKPYTLAGIDEGTLVEVQARVEESLAGSGFEVMGDYSPAGEDTLRVLGITTEGLREATAQRGGLLGFASVLRVGLHETDAGVLVSFMTPRYWGNAYFGKAFAEVEPLYTQLEEQFKTAFAELNETRFEPFGSKKGMLSSKLRKYHYMIGMPYFDDVVVLNTGSTFEDAVSAIESRAATEDSDSMIVYAIKAPEQKMALFGVALSGDKGEAHFLPKIDTGEPRHVPFLPYEMLVLDNKVVALHGKYRIALSFPDLSMGRFMKIVSTPGDIADALRVLASPSPTAQSLEPSDSAANGDGG